MVARPTRAAAELTAAELRHGAGALAELVARHRPRVLAVLGITAWRQACGSLGPASSVRAVLEVGAAPLLVILGFDEPHRIEHMPAPMILAGARRGAEGARISQPIEEL